MEELLISSSGGANDMVWQTLFTCPMHRGQKARVPVLIDACPAKLQERGGGTISTVMEAAKGMMYLLL